MHSVRYIGKATSIRIGDRPIKPGDIISEPADVVAHLATRADFEAVEPPKPDRQQIAEEPTEAEE